MSVHVLRATQIVEQPIEVVFAFFSDPANLGRITPRSLDFDLRSDDLDLRDGLELEYRIRPLLGLGAGWRSRIESWDPPASFVDVQAAGPYRSWRHVHAFTEVAGGTRIDDEVTYEVPLGPIGEVVHRLAVRPRLERIFRHRARAIEAIFRPAATNPEPLTVAVAGGTGFVGRGIAAELHARGHRVVVLSHRGEPARRLLPDAIEIREADAATGEGLDDALLGLDAVAIALAFHNSPMESPSRGQTFMRVDAKGTENVVEAARRAGVRRIAYVSGAGAAPDAKRHWFRAKWRAEEAVRGSGLEWSIVRPTWFYGPDDVALNRFLGFARRLPFVPLTNAGRQPLAPVFVDDGARLVADMLVEPAAAGRVFELGGPETLELREVIGTALGVAGLRRPILPGPTPLLKLIAWPLKFLPEPPLTPAGIDFVNQPATVDVGPLLARLPRRLTPLAEALGTYLAPRSGPGELSFDATPRRARPAGATLAAKAGSDS